jgi:uncharacterized LabA/DUF88 family protein
MRRYSWLDYPINRLQKMRDWLQSDRPIASSLPVIAVFIDAENISAIHIDTILMQIQQLGRPLFIRAYADWRGQKESLWYEAECRHPLQCVQQNRYVKGKSTADMALMIDVMDVLHLNSQVNTFCLVSSDSDFTPLVLRLRASGYRVYGVGQAHTVEAYQHACDHFILINDKKHTKASQQISINTQPLVTSTAQNMASKTEMSHAKKESKKDLTMIPLPAKSSTHNTQVSSDNALHRAILDVFALYPQQEWLALSLLTTAIQPHTCYQKYRPQYRKMMEFVAAIDYLHLGHPEGALGQYYVRYQPTKGEVSAEPPQMKKPHNNSKNKEDQRLAKKRLFDRIQVIAILKANKASQVTMDEITSVFYSLEPMFRIADTKYQSWSVLLAAHPALLVPQGDKSVTGWKITLNTDYLKTDFRQRKLTNDQIVDHAFSMLQYANRWANVGDVALYLRSPHSGFQWPKEYSSPSHLLLSMTKFTVVCDRRSKKMFMRLVSDEPSDILFALGEDPTLPHLISRDALLELIYELTHNRSANKGQMSLEQLRLGIKKACRDFSCAPYGYSNFEKLVKDLIKDHPTLNVNTHDGQVVLTVNT